MGGFPVIFRGSCRIDGLFSVFIGRVDSVRTWPVFCLTVLGSCCFSVPTESTPVLLPFIIDFQSGNTSLMTLPPATSFARYPIYTLLDLLLDFASL